LTSRPTTRKKITISASLIDSRLLCDRPRGQICMRAKNARRIRTTPTRICQTSAALAAGEPS
jgi:hypothetical protein